MGLVEVLQRNLVTLPELPLDDIIVSNPSESKEVQGRIAEELVRIAIRNSPDVDFDFPTPHNGYSLTQHPSGILVTKPPQKEHICEYDFLIRYEDAPYIVEVKSLKLYGFKGKIDERLKIGRDIYNTEIKMVICFPFYTSKDCDIKNIEKNPLVRCLDLGYKRKQLQAVVSRYYRELNQTPHN